MAQFRPAAPQPVKVVPPAPVAEQLVRAKPARVVAWALVRKDGGISPLRLEVDLSPDLSQVDVVSVSLGKADFRAVTQAKVFMSLSATLGAL